MAVNSYPGKNVYFNGSNLALNGIFIQDIDINQVPIRAPENYRLARSHGSKLVSAFYTQKPISISGAFVNLTQSAFETTRDNLLTLLQATDAILYTDVAGVARQFLNVFVNEVTIAEFAGGYAKLEINFIADDPFGYATGYTTLASPTISATPTSTSVTAGGTALVQSPIYTLTLTSFTVSGNLQITLENTTTGESCTFNAAATAGDVLVFDSSTGVVTQNGAAVAFSGVIPTISPSATTIKYTDNASARSVAAVYKNLKRYL